MNSRPSPDPAHPSRFGNAVRKRDSLRWTSIDFRSDNEGDALLEERKKKAGSKIKSEILSAVAFIIDRKRSRKNRFENLTAVLNLMNKIGRLIDKRRNLKLSSFDSENKVITVFRN